MEFTRRGESFSPKKISSKSFLNEKYPTDLNMYHGIPTEQIVIEEFQELAVERVKLLRVLESSHFKGVKGMSVKDIVMDEMTKQNMKLFMPLVRGHADPETRRRDYLSHFILRLFYCRSEEYQKWFIAREIEFFRLKFFNMENKEDFKLFMKAHNLTYTPIKDQEKLSIASDLYNSSYKNIIVDMTDIYKVPFTQALDLVQGRKVFVKSGNAYVPQRDMISIFTLLFRLHLSRSLAICASNISTLESDERLAKILNGLHTSYIGNDYCTKPKDQISRHDIDPLSVKSFPICMRSMYETFKVNHHLRHNARLQFGLFLKGIGLSLEESLKFWREGFTKKPEINGDVFNKQYAYSIRHNYGTEGKRVSYTPHNCLKIINTNVGPGDNHGCPFKHYDTNSLKQKLLSYNISLLDITSIIDYSSKGHYQLACTKYFEITHNITNAKGITHPNMYFEESQNLLNGKVNENVKKVDRNKSKNQTLDEWGDESGFDIDITNIINDAENKMTTE